jgi:transcriptional regulator with XRE-family HTH domain
MSLPCTITDMAKLATSVSRSRQNRYDQYLSGVDRLKGPAPTNPFKWYRLNANLTLQDLAGHTGCSKQALIRLEQGTFTEPIDRVLNFWLEHGSRYLPESTDGSSNGTVTYPEMMQRYEKYQEVIRKRHALIFGPMPLLAEFRRNVDKHPFALLRSLWTHPETKQCLGTMNVTECSKLLCLPQSVLDYFDSKINRQGSVPKPLVLALRQNGYSQNEVAIFEQAYFDHRNWKLNHIKPEEYEAAQAVLNDWRAELLKSYTQGSNVDGAGVSTNGETEQVG